VGYLKTIPTETVKSHCTHSLLQYLTKIKKSRQTEDREMEEKRREERGREKEKE
jgi:hypothetical protein